MSGGRKGYAWQRTLTSQVYIMIEDYSSQQRMGIMSLLLCERICLTALGILYNHTFHWVHDVGIILLNTAHTY